MRTLAAAVGAALAVCLALLARPTPQGAAALTSYRIGDRVEPPALQTLAGDAIDFATLQAAASTALVIEFWSARCPITRGFEKRVLELAQRYARDGVQLVSIAACADESAGEIQTYLRRHKRSAEILLDPGGHLVRKFDVHKTPHFVVLDRAGTLVYSGAFDGDMLADSQATPSYVEQVIADLEALQPVRVPQTRAYGSPVRR